MSWLAWALVIFLTALAVIGGPAWWMGRQDKKIPLARLADPAPLPGELPRAGRFDADWWPDPGAGFLVGGRTYGPFPVDTGPLLIMSEKTAANAALEREIRQRCAEAEAKIPPRWR